MVSAVSVPPVPSAPVLNPATVNFLNVSLNWNAVGGASGYKLKYGTTAGSYSQVLDLGNVTQHTVNNLTAGVTYYFVVSGYNTSGEGSISNQVTAVPQAPPPVNYVQNVTYTATGQISQIIYASGTVTTYTYHPQNLRLTNMKTINAGQVVLQDLDYSYDGVGNILSIADNKTVGVVHD